MVQGAPKTFAAKAPKRNSGKTKKGARVVKSKKASNADRLTKKFSAGLVAKTERLLGERAGHLEMIGKGRVKTKDGKGKDKDGKAVAEKQKGGSRKFG